MAVFQRGPHWHMEFMCQGVKVRRACGRSCKTQTRAQQLEREARAQVMANGGPRPKVPALRDFAARFCGYVMASAELKPKTKASYLNGWRLLAATPIVHQRLDRITAAAAAVLTFPGGPANANQALRTLRRMLSYACECRLLRAAPRIRLRAEEGREATIAPAVEALLLEYASPVLGAVIAIMLDCGMRPEEVARLAWEDVRWEEGRIFVERGKSRKARRYVPLTGRMRGLLEVRRRECEDSPWVFPSHRGGHVSGDFHRAWGRTLKRIAAATGSVLPAGLVLYSARHTFAGNYLKQGGDLGTLMVLLGHTDIRTTQKYLHLGIEGAAAIMDRHNESKIRVLKRA